MRTTRSTIPIFLFLIFCMVSRAAAQQNQLESLNLFIEKLKGNSPETAVDTFPTIEAACASEFVTCDSIQQITELDFQFCNLNGTISSVIANISTLQSINMAYNYLYGGLPDELDRLTELKKVSLKGNFLSRTFNDTSNYLCRNVKFDLTQNIFAPGGKSIGRFKPYDQIQLPPDIVVDSFLLHNKADVKRLSRDRSSKVTVSPRTKNRESLGFSSLDDIWRYINLHIKIPDIARKNQIQGKAYVGIYITREGKMKGINLIRTTYPRYGNSAFWTMSRLSFKSEWIPASYNGETVNFSTIFPFEFRIE